jgi:5,5'-dehydrodivanillate O-demethylase
MFWQPVYSSADLKPGHAIPLHMFGEDFTLYRGESLAGTAESSVLGPQSSSAHLVAFRCAHRGTQLSTGWVEGDEIRCFYHGWKYDGNGQCTEQPAEPEPFCSRIKVRSYPVRDYLGLVFAYLGEGEPPPFPRYPQLEGEGVLETHSYVRECSYFNSIENNMDEVHIAFVHRSSEFTTAGLNESLPEISGEETDYGMIRYGKRPGGVVRVLHLVMPNLLVFKGAPTADSGETEGRDQFAWRVPIDDYQHRSFNVSFVRATGEAAARYRERMERRNGSSEGVPANDLVRAILRGELHVDDVRDRPDIVNIQDAVAQAGQGTIPEREHDHLAQSDTLIALLRKIWLRELDALAHNQPLKAWTQPRQLAAAVGT